jgi:hypothetical protein
MGSISYIGSTNTTQLPNRFNFNKNYFKARLDFIKAPIPPSAFNGAWKFLEQELNATIILAPPGERNYQIKPSKIPFDSGI